MPRGAAVIPRTGKRGVTWNLKFRDANGEQVWETLGREPQWNEAKAQRELGKRLEAVERDRWRKPKKVTFSGFAEDFKLKYLPGRNLKKTTHDDYVSIIDRRLVPFFSDAELSKIDPADVDAYVSEKTAEKLAAKTIRNHLALLRVMFKVARRWRLVTANPMDDVEPPRVEAKEMNVLTEAEIARLLTAYVELADAAEGDEEREWWYMTRRLLVVALGTGMRRGELLGLRWQDVSFMDSLISVRQEYVRGRFDTPKSKTSLRAIEVGQQVQAALREQWQETRYRSDDSLVFCHPALGTPLDPSKVSRQYVKKALKRAKIEKKFRPFHDLRHTSLTHEAAAGNPHAYIKTRAGHAQSTTTDRYIHAAQVAFPGAVERSEERMFGPLAEDVGSETGSN